MKVERVDILHDVGRSLNPSIDIGQIEGGFVQGMGWLTTEELVFDDKGRLLTHAPSTYKIPCASDVPPDFRVALFEGPNREFDDLSFEGGRRAAADARDLGVRRGRRRHPQPGAGTAGSAGRSGDPGIDLACDRGVGAALSPL